MANALPLLCALLLGRAPVVQSRFEQVAPPQPTGMFLRSDRQTRAVVLIHGFRVRFGEETVPRADFHSWQFPRSLAVKELARDADVFAFAYGQDACLDDVVDHGGLGEAVGRLRQLGYHQIVLVGHSAGGLVARQFVEDHPGAGVTKVVQVCCPNGGTPSADFKGPKNQQAFLDCLTIDGRKECLRKRSARSIPAGVQFVCLVGDGDGGDTDGVVPCSSQWTAGLQEQGVPAVVVHVSHWQAMRTPRGAKAVAELVRDDQPRWEPERVRTARKSILHD